MITEFNDSKDVKFLSNKMHDMTYGTFKLKPTKIYSNIEVT